MTLDYPYITESLDTITRISAVPAHLAKRALLREIWVFCVARCLPPGEL